MLLFFFFFKYSHDLSTDLSKTLLFKASFLFKTSFLFQNLFPFFMQSHVFLCLYTIQVCEFYAPLSSFFYFFILFKFPIWTTIPIIKKTTKKIYFLTYSHSENKRSVEKNLTFDHHAWPSSVKPDIAFEITDTVSTYNIYIVLRHTDAYHFNNIYIRATVKEPGDPKGRTGDYDLQLATNDKGWIGTAMDDIYDARLLIQPKTKFRKSGTYHIVLEQLMREDPLQNVLSAGLRVGRTAE